MVDVNVECTTSKYPECVTVKEDFNNPEEEDDRNQVTSQSVIDALSHYTVRTNGAYTKSDSFRRLCYNKYKIGDKIICLPCQHNFHEYCIENWLKWVKSACPVDRKSVVRRQYMKDAINERRNQLLEAYNLKVTSTECGKNEECTSSARDETDVYDSSVRRKNTQGKHGCESSQELELARDPIVISPLGDRQNAVAIASTKISIEKPEISQREKDVATHLEAQTSNDVFLDKYTSQLRGSISATRKSIKTKESSRNKSDREIPEKFQELETVASKFSNKRIKCSKDTMLALNAKCMLEPSLKKSMSPKSKDIGKHYVREKITSKSNVTFGQFLNVEKDSSGWVYLRKCPASSFKAEVKTYNFLSGKTH